MSPKICHTAVTVPVEERLCCNGLEDEVHVLISCKRDEAPLKEFFCIII